MRKRLNVIGVVLLAAFARAQSIGLTWIQSASPGVTSNNVYRSETSGGPYTQIFQGTVPITTYTDTQVLGEQEYCYVVTAVAAGVESPYSPQACAKDTTKPPTGIRAKGGQ